MINDLLFNGYNSRERGEAANTAESVKTGRHLHCSATFNIVHAKAFLVLLITSGFKTRKNILIAVTDTLTKNNLGRKLLASTS